MVQSKENPEDLNKFTRLVTLLLTVVRVYYGVSGISEYYRNIQKGGLEMTQNQVAYFRAVEEARSNAAREAEVLRSNAANEYIQQQSLDERRAANIRRDSLTRSALEESSRHNRAKELVNAGHLGEVIRSNQARETIDRSRIGVQRDQARTDYLRLHETRRANRAREDLESNRLLVDTERAVERNAIDQGKLAVASRQQAADEYYARHKVRNMYDRQLTDRLQAGASVARSIFGR